MHFEILNDKQKSKPLIYYDKRNFNDPRKTVSDSDAASGKISRISKSFQRSKQELKKYFSRHWRCKKNSKTIGAYTESTALIFKAFKKLFISWHCPFKCGKLLKGGDGLHLLAGADKSLPALPPLLQLPTRRHFSRQVQLAIWPEKFRHGGKIPSAGQETVEKFRYW